MRNTKAQIFIRMFHFWCGKLDLPKTIPIIKDNRMDCYVALDQWDTEDICLRYHSRRLGQVEEYNLIGFLFHEMGHYINKLPYNNYEQQIVSEWQAEKFSIKMMKKHYPQLFKQMIKKMKKTNYMKKLEKKDRLYYEAFMQIKEYRGTL